MAPSETTGVESPDATAFPPRPTYEALVDSNLADLLGPAALTDPDLSVMCACSEIEGMVSNLLPDPVFVHVLRTCGPTAAAVPAEDVAPAALRVRYLPDVVRGLARECGCSEAIAALYDVRHDARHDTGIRRTRGDADALIGAAKQFVGLLRSIHIAIPCACASAFDYRFADILIAQPPREVEISCPGCGRGVKWFIPTPPR